MKIKLKKKKYSSGGQIAKDIGAGAYGLGEGLIDNLTSVIPGVGGLVDAGTDKLFNMFNKGNKEAAQVRAVGDVVGNVGGAILTGGATTLGAVTNGIGATNEFIQNTNMSDKGKKLTGIASGLATTVAGLTGTGKVDGVNGLSDIGKMIKYKKGGGVPVETNQHPILPPHSMVNTMIDLGLEGLSVPQKSMMYALTQAKLLPQESWDASNGYRTPSEYLIRNEYMDKNNKAGALAVDTIFDPMNLIGGLGLLTKAAKAANMGKKLVRTARGLDWVSGFIPNMIEESLKAKANLSYKSSNNETDGTTEPIVIRASEYKNGGAIQNNNLIPYNPNDLAGVSNNLIRYDGNTHSNGGIPTPSGEFDKQETVLNSKEPYAFSDNLLITKPLAQMQGLPKKYINKTIADASKMVDNKYKIKVNQPTLLQNANRITADNKLNDLVKTNEMLINVEQQLGTQYMCGGKLRKYACGGVMQKFRLGGNPPLLLEADGSQTGNWQNQNIQYDQQGVPQYANNSAYNVPQSFQGNSRNVIPFENLANVQTINPINSTLQNNRVPVAGKLPPRYGLENLGQYNESTLNTNPRLNQIATGERPNSKVPMFMRNIYGKGLDAYTDSGMTPLEAASLGTKLASHAYEFASVLKKPDKIQTQYNEFNPQVQRLMREQKINNQPILNELNLQSNMLFDRNVGNANTQRANNLTVNSQLMDKINQVKMASQTQNNQYRAAEANSLNQIGQQNVNARNMQEKLQSETNAARDNAIREAFGNVGNDLADYGLKRDVNNKTIREGFKLLKENPLFADVTTNITNEREYMKVLNSPETQVLQGKINNGTITDEEVKDIISGQKTASKAIIFVNNKGFFERGYDNQGNRKNPVATATPKERKTEAEIAEKEAKTEK